MRRAIVVLGAVISLVGGYLAYVATTGIPRYAPQKIALDVVRSPARLERGKKLVLLLCADCHRNPKTRALTGKYLADAPPTFGYVYSKNITRHPTKGIGGRTEGELAYFLRTGVRWDGQYVPPYMPRLTQMADEDLFSILAFLRSDDDLVRANDADVEDVRPTFTTKLLSHLVFSPAPYPRAPIGLPSPGDRIALGRYLAVALECFACHSKNFATNDDLVPERSAGYFGGGNAMRQMDGTTIYTSNLTADEGTGIGTWSGADFRRALHDGFRRNGSLIRYPMTRMPELSDEEVDAIYAYLQTLPKLRYPSVPAPPPRDPPLPDPRSAMPSPGSRIYHHYGCQTCHGETGIAYADLRDANARYPTNDALVAFIRDPTVAFPHTRMPRWDGVIREDEYTPLCEYVRQLAR